MDSFESDLSADESVFGSEPLRAILIRAPMITKVEVLIQTIRFLIDAVLGIVHTHPSRELSIGGRCSLRCLLFL